MECEKDIKLVVMKQNIERLILIPKIWSRLIQMDHRRRIGNVRDGNKRSEMKLKIY